ncbi:hypothetical protein LCGC14_2106120, partial [marine sediment metagenome]
KHASKVAKKIPVDLHYDVAMSILNPDYVCNDEDKIILITRYPRMDQILNESKGHYNNTLSLRKGESIEYERYSYVDVHPWLYYVWKEFPDTVELLDNKEQNYDRDLIFCIYKKLSSSSDPDIEYTHKCDAMYIKSRGCYARGVKKMTRGQFHKILIIALKKHNISDYDTKEMNINDYIVLDNKDTTLAILPFSPRYFRGHNVRILPGRIFLNETCSPTL